MLKKARAPIRPAAPVECRNPGRKSRCRLSCALVAYYCAHDYAGPFSPEHAQSDYRGAARSSGIEKSWQGRGIGRAPFRDAALRVWQAAETIGIRGIAVQAISHEARKFYLAVGFTEYSGEAMTLVVTLQDVRAALSEPK